MMQINQITATILDKLKINNPIAYLAIVVFVFAFNQTTDYVLDQDTVSDNIKFGLSLINDIFMMLGLTMGSRTTRFINPAQINNNEEDFNNVN